MADGIEALSELISVVRTLRGPGGCEWDRSQTVQSLRPFLLEEAYEAADAAESGDWDSLRAELGDLLLHVVMAAVIAEEGGRFDLGSVASGITLKLIRRHPHVFGDREALAPAEVEKRWEAIKAGEKRSEGFFDSIPGSMPALQAAWRIQQRASEVGFEWPGPDETLEAAGEILRGLRDMGPAAEPESLGSGIGKLLFAFVNYARLTRQEPEQLLRNASGVFKRRFSTMESLLEGRGTPLGTATSAQLLAAWRDSAGEVTVDPGVL